MFVRVHLCSQLFHFPVSPRFFPWHVSVFVLCFCLHVVEAFLLLLCLFVSVLVCVDSWLLFVISALVKIKLAFSSISCLPCVVYNCVLTSFDKVVTQTLPPFTQRSHTIAAAVVRQFSAYGHSHGAKQRRRKGEPLCNSHRKPALQILKRRNSIRHEDGVHAFSGFFPQCPVNPNPRTVYNHM